MKDSFQDKIRRQMVKAISDYNLIGEGDRVAVAVSGGKDSSVMLYLLNEIKKRSPYHFEIDAVLLDQNQPGFKVDEFADWVKSIGVCFHLISEDTYSIVKDKTAPGKSYCGLCSRLRRGILYNFAFENGYSKIALRHHRDDLNETILMNLFYSGQLASMPPLLRSDDERNTVIRPLCYVPEEWITDFSQELEVPIIPCRLCGTQEGMRRERIKNLIRELEKEHDYIGQSMLNAQKNIRLSQLSDSKHWNH